MWGGWLAVTAVVFSFMNGIVHPYYTVALAPAIGASIGIGATLLWRSRSDFRAATALSGTVLVTTILAAVLLSRDRRVAAMAAGAWSRSGEWRAAVLLLVAGRLPGRVCAFGGGPGRRGVSGGACGVFGRDGGHSAQRRHPVGGPGAAGLRRFHRSGGLLDSPTPGPALSATLSADAHDFTWVAAHRRVEQRGRLPIGQRRAGDGDRRLQRHRPLADAGRSSSATSPTGRSTTSSAAG